MTILAILFLIGCAVRVGVVLVDNGFGGPVWVFLVYLSCLTWLVGLIMAVHILTGITVEFG